MFCGCAWWAVQPGPTPGHELRGSDWSAPEQHGNTQPTGREREERERERERGEERERGKVGERGRRKEERGEGRTPLDSGFQPSISENNKT